MANGKNSSSTGKEIGAAAAVAGLAAAAAGAYWFFGSKDAPKHRKNAKSFMLRARADVLEAVENSGALDKQTYMNIVDGVVKRYSSASGITAAELGLMARDLKSMWSHMQMVRRLQAASVKKAAHTAKKTARKTVSKTARRTSKK